MAIVAGEASLRRSVGPGASLEDRLGVLEANFKQFEEETNRQFQIGTDKVSHLGSELHVERNARIQTDDETLNQIKDMAIGGLHIELIGVIWVILGILGASIPAECESLISFLLY